MVSLIQQKKDNYQIILKEIKDKCRQLNIFLIYDKLENDGGLCKYKNKIYIIINKFFSDEEKLNIFFNEIVNTDFADEFKEYKERYDIIKYTEHAQ